MNFFIKWYSRKKNTEKERFEGEEKRFEEVVKKQEPVLRELIKEEAVKNVKEADPVEARINEALEKLILKIREKHFSTEIQNAFKEIKEKLYSEIYFSIRQVFRSSEYDITISIDDIRFDYGLSIYDYKDEFIRERLIRKISQYDDESSVPRKISRKTIIEYIYDYFFNGDLEKNIEENIKKNREWEKLKEEEKLQTANELCSKLKDLNIS